MFANLCRIFPGPGNEPDWNRLRTRSAAEIEIALCCGPYYHIKAVRIKRILGRIHADFGNTSLESLRNSAEWPLERTREYLLSFNGVGPKTVSCILLSVACASSRHCSCKELT